MTKPTLDSIAVEKAKLEEELRNLEAQEVELRQHQITGAFDEVLQLLKQYGNLFTAKQISEIVSLMTAKSPASTKKRVTSSVVAPKYWLPHTQETWSGRGRPPRAFTAWEGTAAYKEWKASHPKEKFPIYPG